MGTQGGAWSPGQTALTAEITECQGQGILLLFLQVQETLKAHEEVASSFRERYIPRFKAASGYTKNCSRMETPSLHWILFPNACTWFFNTNVTPWKYNQRISRVAMKSTLDKHYQWWVHLLGIMEVRLSTSWTAVCKNDQIANVLLASEDLVMPSHFPISKISSRIEIWNSKMNWFWRFFNLQKWGEKQSKLPDFVLIGFQCAAKKDLEGWLKFCPSYMIYSQIFAKSS